MPDVCGTCKAPVIWAVSAKGRAGPYDAAPVAGGNVLLLKPAALGGRLLAVVLSDSLLHEVRRTTLLHISHWATCPDRQEWRKRTDAARVREEPPEEPMTDTEARLMAAADAYNEAVGTVHERVACPKCDAPVGEECRRMVGGVGLRERHNKHPHVERIRADGLSVR